MEELRVRLDAEKVGQFSALSFRKAILRVCASVEINPKTEERTEQADTIVYSDILNYVDFRKVLSGFAKYLKPDGRIIVLNLPHRGNRSLFSDMCTRNMRLTCHLVPGEAFVDGTPKERLLMRRGPNRDDESSLSPVSSCLGTQWYAL